MKYHSLGSIIQYFSIIFLLCSSHFLSAKKGSSGKPNFVIIVTDDLSWNHINANGFKHVKTPHIDRLIDEGYSFSNAFASTSSCTPSRSAMLTGRNGFELEQGASLWGYLPKKFQTYTEILAENGYEIGGSGKGWGPGVLIYRDEDPVGELKNNLPYYVKDGTQIVYRSIDYAENLNSFLKVNNNSPFCYWLGPHEPHRPYSRSLSNTIRANSASLPIPKFLPDHQSVREDFNDYLSEVEMIDKYVGKTLNVLKENKVLDNTIIIFTSDNGMPFPRAKTHLYDSGARVPLIVWRENMKKAGKINNKVVSLIDMAPTILEYADIKVSNKMSGKSLYPVIEKGKNKVRKEVLLYRERHSWRKNDEVYISRALRNKKFLLIWNLYPDRLPVDTNNGSTLSLIKGNPQDYSYYYDLSFAQRPEFELYRISNDPDQIANLSDQKKYRRKVKSLSKKLKKELIKLNDPRLTGNEEIFLESPYFGLIFLRGLLNYSHYLDNKSKYSQEQLIEMLEEAYRKSNAIDEFEKIKIREGW